MTVNRITGRIAAGTDDSANTATSRRSLLGMAIVGASLLTACGGGGDPKPPAGNSPTPTPTPTGVTPAQRQSDYDLWWFLQTATYLEAQFHSFSAFGIQIDPALTKGYSAQGTVNGGTAARFTSENVAQFAREIAFNRIDHIRILRSLLDGVTSAGVALAGSVSQSTMNIAAGAGGAFDAAVKAAGADFAGGPFDPYASDANWLLSAYFLSDVLTSAYRGIVPRLFQPNWRNVGAGLLASSAYTSGALRTLIARAGIREPSIVERASKLSDYRDSLDGSTDLDQAPAQANSSVNLTPTDVRGAVLGRTPEQAFNILFLTAQNVERGGFFPQGISGGTIRTSGANG